jgi:hypothetical protein
LFSLFFFNKLDIRLRIIVTKLEIISPFAMSINTIRFFKALSPFFLMVTLILICCYNSIGKDIPKIEKGILDLRDWNFSENKAINLDGEWEFYWNEFLNAEDLNSSSKKSVQKISQNLAKRYNQQSDNQSYRVCHT